MTTRFITVEGGEGAGKSSNLALIEQILIDRGVGVVVTREPGGTLLGEHLRELLLRSENDTPVPMAELLLIFAARAQHLSQVITPALESGNWVVCDRFTDATYAYQGYGRGLDLDVISLLENLVQGTRRPDLTVLFDVDPEIGLSRVNTRGKLDRFEQEDQHFFRCVREGYLSRARATVPDKWLIVDANQPLDYTRQFLRSKLEAWLDVQLG